MKRAGDGRQWFVGEVVQTSSMDCGPASLKAVLAGHGLPVSYGRLREVCQTSVDGTSIDALEAVANQLGLSAEQIMIPADHVLLPESNALPAIAVAALPSGAMHFLVLWRRHGRWVQVMDPAVGRRWVRDTQLLNELHINLMPTDAAAWREWAVTLEFRSALERRIRALGGSAAQAAALVTHAIADETWRALGTLDAAVRMVAQVVRAGGLHYGREAFGACKAIAEQALRDPRLIGRNYWSVRPIDGPDKESSQVTLVGCVLLRIAGKRCAQTASLAGDAEPLSAELLAVVSEETAGPSRRLFELLREDGLLTPIACLAALGVASAAVLVEGVLFRAAFSLAGQLAPGGQRLGAIAALLVFLTSIVLLELPIAASFLRLGRRLEARLRMAYLAKIPRLSDRYFHSRLASDMAERGHMLQLVRRLPELGARALRTTLSLLLTVCGIAWLDPGSAVLAIVVATLAVALPLLAQPALNERDLRMRTHAGALTRFYLDALLGLTPVRAHGAERAIRRQHEELLVDWQAAVLRLQRAAISVDGVLAFSGLALSGLLLARHVSRAYDPAGVLLLAFWALQLPALGSELAMLSRQYPALRNVVQRVMELLAAPEEHEDEDGPVATPASATAPVQGAMGVSFRGVSVRAGGHSVLEDIDLTIEAGSHIAIVGPSGAGKSSLVGLLLGFHRPSQGELHVDALPLVGAHLVRTRSQVAWVDPEVQLWNRSLLENLRYGTATDATPAIGHVLEQADLYSILQRLPDGLQTPLGEAGALVSGGEGQRVRLGRALLRPDTRLVILDEPFRGLDRNQRRNLLARARKQWKNTTLLCVTHDIDQTLDFDRVLVLENGRLVEAAAPRTLQADLDSRYRALLDAELSVRRGLWASANWRSWTFADGRIHETRGATSDTAGDPVTLESRISAPALRAGSAPS